MSAAGPETLDVRDVLRTISDPMWVKDAAGRYQMVNPAWERVTGIAEADVIGRTDHDLFPPEVAAEYLASDRDATEARTSLAIRQHVALGDGWVFETVKTPSFGPDGALVAIVGTARDVTRSWRAAEAERSRTELLAKIARIVPGVLFAMERRPDGTLTVPFASDRFEALFGIPPGEPGIDLAALLDRLERIERLRLLGAISASADTLTQLRLELRLEHPTRGEMSCEIHAQPERGPDGTVAWYGFVDDVTEVRRRAWEHDAEEARQRLLIEQSNDGVAIVDPSGRIVEVNPRFARLVCAATADLLGTPIDRWLAIGEDLSLDPALRVATSALVRVDGSRLPVEATTSGFVRGRTRFTSVACRDLSVESRLLELEQVYRVVLGQTDDGIAVIDPETLRFVEFNDAACRPLGYSRAEFARLTLPDIDPFVDPNAIRRVVLDPDAPPYVVIDAQQLTRSGERRDVRLTGTFIDRGGRRLMAAVWRDVTEDRRAADRLRDNEARWITALEAAGHGVWDWDLATDRVYYSRQWAAMLGYPEGSVGEHPRALFGRIPDEELARVADAFAAHLTGATHAVRVEHRLVCRDGNPKWVLNQGMVAGRDRSGRPTRFVGTMTDLSWRREADEKLRDSEDRHRSVVTALTEGIVLFDTDGRLTTWNPAALRILGVDASTIGDVVAWRPTGTEPEGDGAVADAAPVSLDGAGIRDRAFGLTRPDGTPVWIQVNTEPIRGASGELRSLLVSFVDVTAKRATEQALRASEAQLKLAQAVARIGSWTVDLRTGDQRWSDETFRMFGVPLGSPIGYHTLSERTHPDDRAALFAAWEGAVASGSHDVEHRIVVDGEVRWVRERAVIDRDAEGRALFAHGTAQDVTDHHRAHAQLARLSLAVEQSPTMVVVTDLDGRIDYVNAAFEATSGYTRDELVGQNVALLQAEPGDPGQHDLYPTLAAGRDWSGEFVNRRKDGSTYVAAAKITSLRQPSGEVSHYLSVQEDVTDRRRIERELDRHRHHLQELVLERTAQLERANGALSAYAAELSDARDAAESANRSKSAFLANMSHEIRTPMNAIVGLTHLLGRSATDRAQSERLRKVSDAAHHLLAIVNDILDISKIEAGKLTLDLTELEVGTVVDRVVALISDRAVAKGLAVHTAVDPRLLTRGLRGDPTRLSQILLNFATNAVKFTNFGTIRITARQLSEGPDQLTVRFEVADTGIGISEPAMSRLFKAFEQADPTTTRRYGGTGLGLAISRRLAELMDGEAGVTSELHVGSTFWFTAVLGRDGRASVAPVERTVAPTMSRRGRVLVVEDDPVNQEVALGLLADAGLTADLASDGLAAVRMAEAARYDLILMDVQMPGIDGLEATRRIRRAGSGTPIVAMTASAFGEDRARCLAAGMNDHLAKPVDPATLYDTIGRWIPSLGQTPIGFDRAAAPAAALDLGRVDQLLVRLEALLLEDDLGAQDLLRDGRDLLVARLGRAFGSIERSMEQFDFPAALGALRSAVDRPPDGPSARRDDPGPG
ncbi:MAG: PAS domain S-box protein [Myxococcota bacterium]